MLHIAGVVIGAGWQTTVAYMNFGSYFFFGIPLGLFLGFILDMGVKVISPLWYLEIITSEMV